MFWLHVKDCDGNPGQQNFQTDSSVAEEGRVKR